LAVEAQEPRLETFSQRAPTFFVCLACVIIAGLAVWFGLVELGLWLFGR